MVPAGVIHQERSMLSPQLLCLPATFSLFASPLSHSPCIALILLSQGNQWEPVTLCEQRHYSDDSRCPIKHKNIRRLAELIESGRPKLSVSSRTRQRRMWLKGLNSSKSHKQKFPRPSVPFGPSYFCERGSSRHEKTKHKRNTLRRAVNYICMLISLCCGHQLKITSPLIKICNKIRVLNWEHIYFHAPTSGPVNLNRTFYLITENRLELHRACSWEIFPFFCVCRNADHMA